MLLDLPLDSYPLEPNVHLPPPSMLRRKIIIKNKKKHHHHHHHHKKSANSQGKGEKAFNYPLSRTNGNNHGIWWSSVVVVVVHTMKKTFWLFHDVAYLHNLINQFLPFLFLPPLDMFRNGKKNNTKSFQQQQMYRRLNLISNSLPQSMRTVQLVATIPINKRATVIFHNNMRLPFRWVKCLRALFFQIEIIYESKCIPTGGVGGCENSRKCK